MKTIADGVNFMYSHTYAFTLLIVVVWGMGRLFTRAMIFDSIEGEFKSTTTFCLGFTILCFATFASSFLSLISPILFKFSSLLIAISPTIILFKDIFANRSSLNKILPDTTSLVIFILSLIIRLPYINNIILPSYTDSPIHYQIINQILSPTKDENLILSIENIFKHYYHFGFHSLTAWFSITTGTNPIISISIIGQVALALAPICIIQLTYVLSKSKIGAYSAGLLVTFGWMMPAFSVNWGKFPAITALAIVPSIIGCGILFFRLKLKPTAYALLIFLLTVSLAMIHTRAIIIMALAASSIILIKKLDIPEQPNIFRAVLYSLLFIITLLPLKENLTAFYNRPVITVILILLLPFAFLHYTKVLSGLFLFTSGIWIITFLSKLPPINVDVLNSQFISIAMFIPLSMAGGLGVAGAVKKQNSIVSIIIFLTFLAGTSYNSSWYDLTYPDYCCNFYSQDDKKAFQWIESNTKKDDLFIISTIDSVQQNGTDAGIWIYALTGRPTNKRLFNTNWTDNNTFPNSCNSGSKDIYIYSGGRDYSFSSRHLLPLKWVEKIYTLEKISIYRVMKCPKQ